MLLPHFDEAQAFASPANSADNQLSNDPGHSVFNQLFVRDTHETGIFMTDLASMDLVVSSQDVARVLNDIRGTEVLTGRILHLHSQSVCRRSSLIMFVVLLDGSNPQLFCGLNVGNPRNRAVCPDGAWSRLSSLATPIIKGARPVGIST